MLFNSWEFLVLLLVTFVVFYSVPQNAHRKGVQTLVLLVASAIFYGWTNIWLLPLLIVSCIGNTVAVYRTQENLLDGKPESAKRWVRWTVALNLLGLGFFKYAGMFVSMIPIESVSSSWLVRVPLPIGISFYTFQAIGMVIDAGRKTIPLPVRDVPSSASVIPTTTWTRFLNVGFYIAFFPQLIAGPIVTARSFLPQIDAKALRFICWGRVLRYLIAGFFLKMVIADNLSPMTSMLKSGEFIQFSNGIILLTLLLGYSFQIFADFCGYSMIAIGLGCLFGYRLPTNFNFPYISRSLTQFWQTWNMTLSRWLREYLYIPLGGNRKGQTRTYVNLFLVMLLGGLWHGADWRFVLWGALHGIFLALERIVKDKKWRIPLLLRVFGIPYCFAVVTLLWISFLLPDVHTMYLFFKQIAIRPIASMSDSNSIMRIYTVVVFGMSVVLFHAVGWIKRYRRERWRVFVGSRFETVLYAIMFFLILTNSGPQTAFVYFRF